MKIKYTLLAAAAMSVCTAASAVDWGGYTRIGPGQKQNSGDGKRCFDGGAGGGDGSQAPGHGGIGRLGNECNTYGEFALSQGATAGGVNYKALLMTNFYSGGSTPARDTSLTGGQDGDNTTRVAQLYIEGKGYSVLPTATFWVGRRFYHRADVHFDDSFYVMGGLQGSTGAGVDTINTGFGSLGVAVFRTPDESTTLNPGTLLNVDMQDMPVNPGGKLRITASFTDFSGVGGQTGAGISVQHNQTGIFGAENTLWLQYAQGSTWLDMGFAGGTDGSGEKRMRIADSLAWLNGPLTAQTLIHYGQVEHTNGTKAKTTSIAGRVAYALTNNFKLQAELGTATTKPAGGGSSQSVSKITVAPTLAVGPNYYDRPELRLYVSGFSMNDAYRIANGQSKKSKSTVGIQGEIWF